MLDFFKLSGVDARGAWAKANCSCLQECWDRARPELLVWIATREGVLDDTTLRRFVCFCARQVWNLLTPVSRGAVEAVERYCNGDEIDEELAKWEAVATKEAIASTRLPVPRVNALLMAAARVEEMAWAVARAADKNERMYSLAEYTARAAARAATETRRAEQADWLRKNAKPNFEGRCRAVVERELYRCSGMSTRAVARAEQSDKNGRN